MGFLSKQWSGPRASVSYGPLDPFWYEMIDGKSETGLSVNADTAMRIAAVYSCVRVIAETIATLPALMYQRLGNGGKRRASEHPLYGILHDQPNNWQTSVEYWEMVVGHVALRGNSYSQIRRTGGRIDELVPLDPRRMTVELLSNNRLQYRYKTRDGEPIEFGPNDIFHLRGLSSDGLLGQSPIAQVREAFALALAQERFGAKFFKNGMAPSGVYETDKQLSEQAYGRLKASLHSERSGVDNAHKTLILEEGLKWNQVGVNGRDAQFLEARKYQRSEIAGIFRVPPHMIGDLDRATFSNIEHQGINFVVHTIRPWLVRIEKAILRDLIVDDEAGFFAEFLVDGLLRGDQKARYDAYAIGIQNEIITRNEARSWENLNPVDGGDEFRNPIVNPQESGGHQVDDGEEDEEIDEPEDEEDDPLAESAGDWVRAETMRCFKPELWFDLFTNDAATRIANAELRELQKHAAKAGNDLARFHVWLESFYQQHELFAAKTILPIVEAMELPTERAAEIAKALSKKSLAKLRSTSEPGELIARSNPDNYAARVAAIIKENLK